MSSPNHKSRYTFWLLFAVCLLGFTPCHARGDDDVTEQSFLQDMPVVLSASRLKQPLSEAPNAVTVIDRTLIKASGFRTIADLFRLVPGMYVDYMNGFTPIVSYRGATDEFTRRMQVLVDGRSVYLQPFNTVNWEDLPLHINDIERIEVVRGPSAASHGSNSIQGVISIITREASAMKGASISATEGNAGNAGISDAVAHFGSSGEHADYRITIGKRADNGLAYTNGDNDNSSTHMANLRANYHPNWTDSFDLQLGYSNGTRTTGHLTQQGIPVDFGRMRDRKNTSGFQMLTWLHTLGQNEDIRLHCFHIHRNTINEGYTFPVIFNGNELAGPSLINDNQAAERSDVELQHTAHISLANRLVLGLGVRVDSVDAPSSFTPASQSLQQHRIFAHDEWRASPQLLLNTGAMLEDDGMGHTNLSPRLSLNFHVMPEHTLRAGISVAYRNPALAEERGNQRFNLGLGLPWQTFLASGGLRPERALSREIGYLGDFHNGLTIDARVYNDQVSDIIWLDGNIVPTSFNGSIGYPSWDFRNDFTANYKGLEGAIKYDFRDQESSLSFNYAHQLVSAVLLGVPKSPASLPMFQLYAQDFSKTVPLNSGSLMFTTLLKDRVSFSFGYFHQGSVQVLSANRPQPLARRMDVRIAKQFGPAGEMLNKMRGGEIALVLQNAFQDDIVEYAGTLTTRGENVQFGRRAYLTATINF